MSSAAALEWWQNATGEAGVQSVEKLLPRHADWSTIVASGATDLQRAIQLTGMQTGPERTVVEIGCGVGRMTAPLAQRFGRVIGLDVARAMIEQARQHIVETHVSFEVIDGRRIAPQAVTAADSVFSYEVFYYIEPPVLADYFRDVHQLLKPGGEFVFQLNLEPIRWTTRLSYRLRDVLYALGIKQFRQWPTGPGFRRHEYTREWVCRSLIQCGFESLSITGPQRRETWFVARKAI